MSVHYKFKSALEYDTVTFDGLHISVRDLKKSILHQKRIGKNTDFDLQITNAQTKEVYTDDNILIPKNTSLIVARIPLTAQQKKAWDRAESNQQMSGLAKSGAGTGDSQDPGVHRLAKTIDLSSLDASEEDKIQAMMTQSTQDYNPSNYMHIRGANQMGDVPPNYRCYKCHQPGHWIKNCPLGINQEPIEIKKSTGIPRSFMVPVDGPSAPGAMMTPTGHFAVPAIDHQAYKEGKKERPPFQQEPQPVVEKPEIPEDLVCSVCKDLLTDAVMIPCCGNSFCDECIRTVLLESEDHECPDCKEKDVSPDTLIPNRFLRNAVNNFKNETGYHKSSMRRVQHHTKPAPVLMQQPTLHPNVIIGGGHPIVVTGPGYDAVEVQDCANLMPSEGPIHSSVVTVITSTGNLVHHQELGSGSNTIPVLVAPEVNHPGQTHESHPSLHAPSVPVGNGSHPIHQSHLAMQHSESGHGNPSSHGPPLHVGHSKHPEDLGHLDVGVPGLVELAPSHLHRPALHHRPPHQPDMVRPNPLEVGVPVRHMSQPHHHEPPHGSAPSVHHPEVPHALLEPHHGHLGPRMPLIRGPHTPLIQHGPQGPGPGIHPHGVHPSHEGHQQHQTFPPGVLRRSLEERPGTPTIDEHNLDSANHGTLPDTSVPPPNFGHVEEPAFRPASFHIENLGVRPHHRMPYRGEHMFGPPHRNFSSRGQFEHGPAVYHHEPGPRPHFPELDRENHPIRGGYRGFHRGRGRNAHGGFRGSHLHHQPPPPGLGRGNIHNGGSTGTIDDPLEAFERMLREKDNRDRRLRRHRRSRSRSYSRSRSRSSHTRSYSRSRSRSVSPRSRTPRSRTPRKRSRTRTRSRSRSRSFSISRSRSRSFSRTPSPRGHSPRDRDFSPRRRAGSHFRTPPQSPPPRFQRPFKETRQDFEAGSYYDPDFQQYQGRGRGGRFAQRKEYGKDYFDQNYSRFGSDRFGLASGGREVHHRLEPLLPPHAPTGPPRFEGQQRRYEFNATVGPDLPSLVPYDKPRYERSYDRGGGYEGRPTPEQYLAPPGLEHRRPDNYSLRDRDSHRDVSSAVTRERDSGPRDRDVAPPARERDLAWERDVVVPREKERDVERERDRGRDYYERPFEAKTYSYGSPDGKKRKQSASPVHRGRSRDRLSGEGHRHVRSDSGGSKRRGRNPSQQPVEAVDVNRDRDSDKRERVLVEVRKEPSVDRDRPRARDNKTNDDKNKEKKTKDKKKKKKEKDVESEKPKKKKRKERKEGKKDGPVKEQGKNVEKKEKKIEANEEKEKVGKVGEKTALSVTVRSEEDKTKRTTPPNLTGEQPKASLLKPLDAAPVRSAMDGLYADMDDARIDNMVVANYGKVEVQEKEKLTDHLVAVDKPKNEADGAQEDKDVKQEPAGEPEHQPESARANIMLAPLPEPSKWELEEDVQGPEDKSLSEQSVAADKSWKVVTSEVLKRAENAIFQKAINALRSIEPAKRSSSGEKKLYPGGEKEKKQPVESNVENADVNRKVTEKDSRETRKVTGSIQVTIPIASHVERSVEISPLDGNMRISQGKSKLDRSKFNGGGSNQKNDGNTSPHRVSAKDRLGLKLDAEGSRKKDDEKEVEKEDRGLRGSRHRSQSSSRDQSSKYAPRKGLKSAVERKDSRSRSPHHRKAAGDRDRKEVDARRYMMEMARYTESSKRYQDFADARRRYMEGDRDRRGLDKGMERRKVLEHRDKKYYSPERKQEVSVPKKLEDKKPKQKEEREKSPEKSKNKHKLKKKTKSESGSRRKSGSDKESKRGRKKDKKHKKEKGKRHKEKEVKERDSNTEKDEIKSKDKGESVVKESKLALPGDREDKSKAGTAEGKVDANEMQSKGKPRKGSRRNPRLASDRKKSTLDEASFEPDYDASSSVDSDGDDIPVETDRKAEIRDKSPEVVGEGEKSIIIKKRERSESGENALSEKKRQRVDKETEKSTDADSKKVVKGSSGKSNKKQPRSSSSDSSDEDTSDDSSTGTSSSSDDYTSEDSADRKRRRKKSSKQRHRKRNKRSKHVESSSDSDSESDSDDGSSSDSDEVKSRKSRSSKKHRHHTKSKASKKKKKSKHK